MKAINFKKISLKKIAVAVLVAAVLVWLVSSAVVTWRLTRRARPPFAEPPPSVAWAPIEPYRLETADGQSIGAWLVRSDERRPCVILLHGNGGSRGSRLDVMKLAWQNGYSVMAVSLRCHGDSTGEVNDFGFSARHDVVAAVDFIEGEMPGRPIYVVGRSLGAAAAIFAAEELGDRVSGYFLEQPYRDLQSATWNRLQNRLPVGLDAIAYAGVRLWSLALISAEVRQQSPFEAAGEIPAEVPVVVATGSADQHAREADVRAVFRQVESEARLVVFEGAKHESLYRFDPQLYSEVLLEFLAGGTEP